MKKRAILVHGFNVDDGGANTIMKIAPNLVLERYEIVNFSTKWKRGLIRDLFTVRFQNDKRARKLAGIIREGDLLIGHSNGCALIDNALWQLSALASPAKVDVVYFNPALDKDTPLAPQVRKALVFFTKTDKAVLKAKIFRNHPWGEMGRTGYIEREQSKVDPRYTSIAYESMAMQDLKHSGVFHKPSRVFRVVEAIKDWLN